MTASHSSATVLALDGTPIDLHQAVADRALIWVRGRQHYARILHLAGIDWNRVHFAPWRPADFEKAYSYPRGCVFIFHNGEDPPPAEFVAIACSRAQYVIDGRAIEAALSERGGSDSGNVRYKAG